MTCIGVIRFHSFPLHSGVKQESKSKMMFKLFFKNLIGLSLKLHQYIKRWTNDIFIEQHMEVYYVHVCALGIFNLPLGVNLG